MTSRSGWARPRKRFPGRPRATKPGPAGHRPLSDGVRAGPGFVPLTGAGSRGDRRRTGDSSNGYGGSFRRSRSGFRRVVPRTAHRTSGEAGTNRAGLAESVVRHPGTPPATAGTATRTAGTPPGVATTARGADGEPACWCVDRSGRCVGRSRPRCSHRDQAETPRAQGFPRNKEGLPALSGGEAFCLPQGHAWSATAPASRLLTRRAAAIPAHAVSSIRVSSPGAVPRNASTSPSSTW